MLMNKLATGLLLAASVVAPVLAKDAAAVCGAEVKVQIDPAETAKAATALGGKPSARTIVLYDTPSAELLSRGVILRYRAGKKGSDLTVKVRPAEGKTMAKPDGKGDFKCESDVNVDGSKPAFSFKVDTDPPAPRDGTEMQDRITKGQKRFLAAVPIEVMWGQVTARPPVASTEWEGKSDGMELSLEQWKWADQTVLELSTKVPPADVPSTLKALQDWAAKNGLKTVPGVSKVTTVLTAK